MSEYGDRAAAAADQIRTTGHTEMVEVVGMGMRAVAYALLDLAAAIRERG